MKQDILFKKVESIAQIGYWEVDLTTNKFFWSDGVFHMLGYESQSFDVNFERLNSIVHSDDRSRVESYFNKVVEQNEKYSIQKRLIKSDGEVIHVLSKAEFTFDEKKKPIKLTGVFQDITELVVMNAKYLEEKNLAQELIQNLPNVFFMFNDKGRFVMWNNRLLEVSEYTEEEVANMSPLNFFDEESKKLESSLEIFRQKIEREIKNAKLERPACIKLKMNSLTDYRMIDKLYEANNAGVKIQLIVRGVCCLVPGVPGMSENIEAISIVDNFLEHSRTYIFCNNDNPEVYISSADFMTRNLDARVEVTCPIYDRKVKQELIDTFEIGWKGNVKARNHSDKFDNLYRNKSKTNVFRAQFETYNYFKNKLEE